MSKTSTSKKSQRVHTSSNRDEFIKKLQNVQLQLARAVSCAFTARGGYNYCTSLEQLQSQLQALKIDSREDFEPGIYLAYNLLRKYSAQESVTDKQRDAAFESFLKGEKQCADTNKRLKEPNCGHQVVKKIGKSFSNVILWDTYTEVCRVVGKINFEDFLKDNQVLFAPFSNGATTTASFKDVRGRPWIKENGVFVCTKKLYHKLQQCSLENSYLTFKGDYTIAEDLVHSIATDLRIRFNHVELNDCSLMAFVPKNADTARTINVENSGNMLIQKLLGTYLRACLKRCGIDLNDQTVNQRLAYIGSRCGDLVTLDLENASNTVSTALVQEVIPTWLYKLLKMCRTSSVKTDLGIHELEMWSAMGNGYTFELESLIFYSVLKAVCKKPEYISVYGDDLIIHRDDVDAAIQALQIVGFKINQTKSFISTPWRESCGKHYRAGLDFTPGFMRKPWKDITELYAWYNSFSEETKIMFNLESIVFSIIQKAELTCYFGPYCESSTVWLFTHDISLYKVKYSKRYQRLEYIGHYRKPVAKLRFWAKKRQRYRCDPVEEWIALSYRLRSDATDPLEFVTDAYRITSLGYFVADRNHRPVGPWFHQKREETLEISSSRWLDL